ncbi:MAG TPA: hypothetical protein VHY21_06445 [Pseudonocardiaceae bacterium]|nr:hypothetical protein [Pseudonocardiaceae bacterium]
MMLPCTHSSTRMPAAFTGSGVALAFTLRKVNRLSSVRNSTTGIVQHAAMVSRVRSRARISTSASRTASSPYAPMMSPENNNRAWKKPINSIQYPRLRTSFRIVSSSTSLLVSRRSNWTIP